jgi:hypothetical protein
MTPHVLGPGFGGAIDENSPLRALAHAAADLYGATLAVEREFSDDAAAATVTFDSKARRVAELVGSGASDGAIAASLGCHRLTILRHRQNHIVAPARALMEAANKGRDAQVQRQEIEAAAEAGDPAAWLGLTAVVADLKKVNARLERTAEAAEAGGRELAVASLSSQQLKAVEVRAKMGNVGSYGQRQREGGDFRPFVLQINFGDGRTDRIEGVPEHTIDMKPGHPADFLPARLSPPVADEDDGEFEDEV